VPFENCAISDPYTFVAGLSFSFRSPPHWISR